MRLAKVWIDIDRLSIKWKSDLSNKIKCNFFQAAAVSIFLYGCNTWTLIKRLMKKLDGNYSKMLRAILNKSWKQHLKKKLRLYGQLPLISKTIRIRRTRHAGEVKTFSYGPLHMDVQVLVDKLETTCNSSVRILDVVLKTCWK